MTDIVKVSWSGGKDSTCALLKHLESGHIVKAVNYIPMFDENIPLITKHHYDFIHKTADLLRKKGADVYIVNGITYYDHVTTVIRQRNFKGMIHGFPVPVRGMCSFARDSKIQGIKKLDMGYFDYEDIGIAYDEKRRKKQLNDRLRSILCELQITEEMATNYCYENGVLSPLYIDGTRDGCTLCPNAKPTDRLQWFEDYPEAIPKVIELQELCKCRPKDKGRYPLRDYRLFIDTVNPRFWEI